ncbi:imelysin family protein [Leucothrix pacifica]|uniref:Peptidase n=1 Tax=Leucothrix pacifica TaxID=1247513 RepID=A0A317C5B2_9GAMM|nr:imelysin family protein [Leucothrix pacifica]PWQ92553.1 peptidase [Leucothrix pacifica]
MNKLNTLVSKVALAGALQLTVAGALIMNSATVSADDISPKATMNTYVNIAHAAFSDSLSTAKNLKVAVDALVNTPSEETLTAAKQAWLAARVPYGQTEVFRFANPNVDDWEGKVNAWPLDEGLIDYVDTSYEHEDGNKFGQANIISGKEPINIELLESYHEKGGSEANVATGYHAIEFLLWGQDLNKNANDAGTRPFTDYAKGDDCTNGNCDRRGQYLTVATDLLIKDLEEIVADWAPESDNYRKTFLSLDENEAVRRMLFGMGSLSLGELAGERINVALLAHSQEDEHSCFSDNTHIDIAENARGIQNVFRGEYKRPNGDVVKGVSLAELVAAKDTKLSESLTAKLNTSQSTAAAVVEAAETGEHFDQQILPDNAAGNARIQAVIDALRSQTADIETSAGVLGIDNLNSETNDSFGES